MPYPIQIKQKATELRNQGFSVKDIAKILNIAVGTSSVWVRDVDLSELARQRILDKQVLSRWKSAQTWKKKSLDQLAKYEAEAIERFEFLDIPPEIALVLCSFLFWAEGTKYTNSFVGFINSDPQMMRVFLGLLRKSFPLDEKKFRAIVHIHEYHNEAQLHQFWSDIMDIPMSQFTKSYLKAHTAQRKRENYMGTCSIRYYDYKIALQLRSTYNVMAKKFRGVR